MHKIFQRTLLTLTLAMLGTMNTAFAGMAGGCVIAGPDDAAITIEEFADFECLYCAKGSDTMKEVLKDYAGKVKLVFRNMPLLAHPNALVAAKAFTAVWLQSPRLAYSYQAALFANQDQFVNEGELYLYTLANELGVNVVQMKADMNGEQVAKSIAQDQQLAQSRGFKGTPSFMIGTEPITGARPYEDIKKIIDAQLAR